MPIGPKRMPLMQHIGELRRRLAYVIVVFVALVVVLYFFSEPIFKFLMGPLDPIFEGDQVTLFGDGRLMITSALGAMTVRFRLAAWAALVVGSPVYIYHLFAFFLPALKPKERRWFLSTFVAAVVLFFVGVAFCYYIVMPPGMEWLIDQSAGIFQYVPTGDDLLKVVQYFLIGFGVAFETPIVVFYLVYFGVVPYEKLRKNWRVVWVVIVTVAASITPDWNPLTMMALAVAMILLYEGSLALVRVLLARKIRAQQAEWGDDDDPEE